MGTIFGIDSWSLSHYWCVQLKTEVHIKKIKLIILGIHLQSLFSEGILEFFNDLILLSRFRC